MGYSSRIRERISLDYLSRQHIGDLVLYGSRLYGLTIQVYSHTIPRNRVKVLLFYRVGCVWRTICMSTQTILLTSVDSHKSSMLKSNASYDCADRPCEHNRDRLVSWIASMCTWTIHEWHHNVSLGMYSVSMVLVGQVVHLWTIWVNYWTIWVVCT